MATWLNKFILAKLQSPLNVERFVVGPVIDVTDLLPFIEFLWKELYYKLIEVENLDINFLQHLSGARFEVFALIASLQMQGGQARKNFKSCASKFGRHNMRQKNNISPPAQMHGVTFHFGRHKMVLLWG